jgi:tetratricopeptide (TPR) repeat protein
MSFNYNRNLPFRKKGIIFRKGGVKVRLRGVTFGNDGVSNIDISPKEDPVKLNNQGIKYYNKGKYKTALNYFNKALAIAPSFDIAKRNRVYCIKMLRNIHEKEKIRYAAGDISVDYSSRLSQQTTPPPQAKQKPVTVYPMSQTSPAIQKTTQRRDKKFNYTQYDYMHQVGWDNQRRRY